MFKTVKLKNQKLKLKKNRIELRHVTILQLL